MAGKNKGSRQRYEPRHFRLYHSITESGAWMAASGNAIKVYIALCRYNDGDNNGRIPYSERRAALDTGLNRRTCRKALSELDSLGFIKPTSRGHFKMKQSPATTWRLTHLPAPGCSPANPTRDFEKHMETGNKSRGQVLSKHGGKITPPLETPMKSGGNITPPETETSGMQRKQGGGNNTPQLLLPQGPQFEKTNGNIRNTETPETQSQSELRNQLIDQLRVSAVGTQTRIANDAGIPKGTLSKFINGSGLPLQHQTALKLELVELENPTQRKLKG